MNDQPLAPRHKHRAWKALAALSVLSVVGFLLWAQRGLAECDPPEVSPGGRYEVVTCAPTYSSYLFLRGSMPRFLKFRDRVRKIDLGSSEIIDLTGNGEIWWPTAEFLEIMVGVGDSAVRMPVAAPDGQ